MPFSCPCPCSDRAGLPQEATFSAERTERKRLPRSLPKLASPGKAPISILPQINKSSLSQNTREPPQRAAGDYVIPVTLGLSRLLSELSRRVKKATAHKQLAFGDKALKNNKYINLNFKKIIFKPFSDF